MVTGTAIRFVPAAAARRLQPRIVVFMHVPVQDASPHAQGMGSALLVRGASTVPVPINCILVIPAPVLEIAHQAIVRTAFAVTLLVIARANLV